MGADLPDRVELERIHRALGPRPTDPVRPRNVICRLHHYAHKELIACKAWEAGEQDFDGATIKVLPDLSRATLQRRAMLRPLLDLARWMDASYCWGYPLSVTFRKDQKFSTFRVPESLLALFIFLGAAPIPLPNWLVLLPRYSGRPNQSMQGGGFSPRPQRNHHRPRALSPEDNHES